MNEREQPRICETCRVITTFDEEQARWVHPLSLQEKFSDHACEQPEPGRPAKPSEARWGRGKTYNSDKYQVLGSFPQLEPEPDQLITIGVDGSYKLITGEGRMRKPMSWGFLSTAGNYGLGTATLPGSISGPDRPLQAELRAIWWALLRTSKTHPVRVISDSQDAVALARAWRQGDLLMPDGYRLERQSGREATLLQLAKLIRDREQVVDFEWVRGHTGHPLNEGANALAKMGRALAVGRLEKEVVQGDARRVVLESLTRYASILSGAGAAG